MNEESLANLDIKPVMKYRYSTRKQALIVKAWIPPLESKRLNLETGIYNTKPLAPNYFKDRFHTAKVLMVCPYCDKQVFKHRLHKHCRSQKCIATQVSLNISTPYLEISP